MNGHKTARPAKPHRLSAPLILAYHVVGNDPRSRLVVKPSVFERHIRFLRERGYCGYRFSDAERLRRVGELPRKSVVITFDDAEESVAVAASILAGVGWPATVFVVTDFTDGDRRLRWPGLDDGLRGMMWPKLRELCEMGWEVGSHTCSHPLLTALDDESAGIELANSRERIIGELGSCEALAYPYGLANARIAAAAETAGYLAACTCRGVSLDDSEYLRPRVALWNAHQGIRLIARLSRPAAVMRRSRIAWIARRARRRRGWLPSEPGPGITPADLGTRRGTTAT